VDGKAILKTNQEQAVASWINYLNQIRLDRLMEALNQQNKNWSDAMITIEIALSKIKEDILIGGKGYRYWVKHYEEGSQFGIDGGRISKLMIKRGGEIVCNYDRGWDVEAVDEDTEFALAILLKDFN